MVQVAGGHGDPKHVPFRGRLNDDRRCRGEGEDTLHVPGRLDVNGAALDGGHLLHADQAERTELERASPLSKKPSKPAPLSDISLTP